jgi:hypothetical protein
MTELLEKAFSEASKLSAHDQDAIATLVLEELASEQRWDQAFAGSHDVLTQLAVEALDEHKQGRTETLDPDKL